MKESNPAKRLRSSPGTRFIIIFGHPCARLTRQPEKSSGNRECREASTASAASLRRRTANCSAFSTNAIINLEDATGKRLNRVNLQPLPASAGSKYQFLANTAAPVTVNDKVIIAGDDGGVDRRRSAPRARQPSCLQAARSKEIRQSQET